MTVFSSSNNWVKSVQIRSSYWSIFSRIPTENKRFTPQIPVFSSNARKYGPEKTPFLNTFHTANAQCLLKSSCSDNCMQTICIGNQKFETDSSLKIWLHHGSFRGELLSVLGKLFVGTNYDSIPKDFKLTERFVRYYLLYLREHLKNYSRLLE